MLKLGVPKNKTGAHVQGTGGYLWDWFSWGDKEEPVSEKDIERLLNKLITDPNYTN